MFRIDQDKILFLVSRSRITIQFETNQIATLRGNVGGIEIGRDADSLAGRRRLASSGGRNGKLPGTG